MRIILIWLVFSPILISCGKPLGMKQPVVTTLPSDFIQPTAPPSPVPAPECYMPCGPEGQTCEIPCMNVW